MQRWEVRNQEGRKDWRESGGTGNRKDKKTNEELNTRIGAGFNCFGHFEWIIDAQTGEAVKWRRLKDRELMAYLVHKRNRFVLKGSILEDLWPGANPEQATAFLHTCVYNIRKMMNTLSCKEKLEYRDNSYRLELLEMWCDTDEFERIASGMEVDASNIDRCEVVAKLYKGNYMDKEGFIWAYESEEALKEIFITLMHQMADFYVSIRNYESA
ncbi:winged helix-turn-helix domain-containing protein [Paenibacillus sp. N3.4]|uniref:AfsR/SARP family transcriptional regulator n=1 Tax=Paenibacillus sp. N3.4 TaxID=2603222 RepID=UPI00164FFC36|nr:winged helix-turn-helix domain-containing protein [Paenibacillus sp. N3.4]